MKISSHFSVPKSCSKRVHKKSKYFLFLLLALGLSSVFGQTQKDPMAIVQLLNKEAATWQMGDLMAHTDFWQDRPSNLILVATLDGNAIDVPVSTMKNKKDTTSYIQTVDITTGQIETILAVTKHFEAPNWHPDNYLILNSYGKIYTLDLATKKMTLLDTGFATQCNNDHGISPDNKWLVVSHHDENDPSPKAYKSAIYILPIEGGKPRRVTSEVMSFWHGWSPDGKTLAYCAERNGNFDIYTIGVEGGAEKRLTATEGLDDGPDYSPDGKYIYFNSYRTGHMQIWRMLADGTSPEQLTFDENSNWFPHPSPDGKWIVYIAYTTNQEQGHPFGQQVKLRLMNLESKAIKDITPVFFGGQGTINVPSWSPDSKKVAFVRYAIN